jgi:hypothetical protein
LKAAALGQQSAIALGRVSLKFRIDLTDTGNSLLGIATRIGSLVGIAFTQGKKKKRLNMELRNSGIRN